MDPVEGARVVEVEDAGVVVPLPSATKGCVRAA